MIENRFYLNDFEIDEPMGFADIVQGMIRDQDWSGVYFQATVNDLTFYGLAADYLNEQKSIFGLKANVIFRAEEKCDPLGEFEPVLIGRLNFGRFRGECGMNCFATMPVEQEGCAMLFRNRYDQSVNIDSTIAFDKITNLGDYAGLGFEMELAAQEFDARVKGSVGTNNIDTTTAEMGPMASNGIYIWAQNFRPTYFNEEFNSIATGSLVPGQSFAATQYNRDFKIISEDFMTPQLLFDDNLKCYDGVFSPEVNMRIKGVVDVHSDSDDYFLHIVVFFVKFRPVEDAPFPNWLNDGGADDPTILPSVLQKHKIYDKINNVPTNVSVPFDFTYSNPALEIKNGESLYAYVSVLAQVGDEPPQNMTATVVFDPVSSIDIRALRSCPPTPAQVYLVNETLSRITEAITNNCVKVKSDYYGRVDSQPYNSPNDGCGSLRILTNGLKLRNADTNTMFLSMQQAFEGLRGIDNIGMGFEPNVNMPGFEWLRIEPVEYFFQDIEVLRFPFVPRVLTEVDESKHYSIIKIGYNKWEPKTVGGLAEFNSTREFRTSLETVRNTLDATSNLVAAGTVIEITRQQSFVETGEADTTYDNDTFIICVQRLAYDFIVEQGVIGSPSNIFSPNTVYNYRITPLRNLLRWFKSIINSYANIADSAAKLFFSQGTGNYTAAGELIGDCSLEKGPRAENIDVSINDFENAIDAIPVTRPENMTIVYPFTGKEWAELKKMPYGYCSVQCGNGDWLKGYVTEIQWRRKQGEAEIKLKLKW